jgi:TetR/AcrR family transcriptional regulator, regulator of cefoperazone and chloramphenicol sensitivity
MAHAYGDRPAEDLTARARIIDAALSCFAERGARAASMKAIAETAGVSVGLVQHHFKTKDNLRKACDDRVLDVLRLKTANAHPGGQITDPGFLGSLYDAALPIMPYVARAALEDDERAALLFDEVANLTARFLTDQWPERFPEGAERTRAAAAVMLALNMSTVVLHHQLVRLIGLDADEPIPSVRIGIATLDVYRAMGDFLDSPFGEQFREAVDRYQEGLQT